MRSIFRAGFRVGLGPFSFYVRLPVAVCLAGMLAVAQCARAGSAPPGAPVVVGCLSVVTGICQDGGGTNIGGWYALQRVVGADGWVYGCATLNASGMCPAPALIRWSALSPANWIARDRIYAVARADGVLLGTFPTSGLGYDSVAYAQGGQWVMDSPEIVEALGFLGGLLLIVILAISFSRYA